MATLEFEFDTKELKTILEGLTSPHPVIRDAWTTCTVQALQDAGNLCELVGLSVAHNKQFAPLSQETLAELRKVAAEMIGRCIVSVFLLAADA